VPGSLSVPGTFSPPREVSFMHSGYYKLLGPLANLAGQHECLAVFLLMFLGVLAIPLPVEGVLLFVGYHIHIGSFYFLLDFFSAFLGCGMATALSFGIGYFINASILNKIGSLLPIPIQKKEYVTSWFKQRGIWGPILGYFLPVVRHFIGFIAGVSKVPPVKFMITSSVGIFFWSATFIGLGFYLRDDWHQFSKTINAPLIFICGIVILSQLFHFLIKLHKIDPKTNAEVGNNDLTQ